MNNAGPRNNFKGRIQKLFQQEGVTGIGKRIKNRLLSGFQLKDAFVYSILYRDAVPPNIPEHIHVEELVHPSEAECEEMAKYRFHTNSAGDVPRYLSEGQRCFVARCDQKIVSWLWIMRDHFYDYRLRREIQLAKEEDYYLGLFTIPEFRGKRIMDTLFLEALQIQLRQSPGSNRRAVGFVDTRNFSSQKVFEKVGCQKIGHVGFISVFDIRLTYIIGRNVMPRTKQRFLILF